LFIQEKSAMNPMMNRLTVLRIPGYKQIMSLAQYIKNKQVSN